MSHLRLLVTFAFLSVLTCSRAFALAGELTWPSLSFPADSKIQKSVMDVISDKKFQFLRGSFLNSSSTLAYAGDIASLNSFLSRLAQCEGAKVNVTFGKEEGDAVWTLSHFGWGAPDVFEITVNSAHIDEPAVKLPK